MTTAPSDAWICEWLRQHHIAYARADHPPVFTCEESDRLVPSDTPGVQTKNLFLRDKKGTRHWLVVTSCSKAVDIRALGDALNAGRLSFGSPERLLKYLGVTPGAVTLLALAFEGAVDVEVVIDADIHGQPLRCHPMVNTATLSLQPDAVAAFLSATGHKPTVRPLAALPDAPSSSPQLYTPPGGAQAMKIARLMRRLSLIFSLSLVSAVSSPSRASSQSVPCLASIDSQARARMQNLKAAMRLTNDPGVQATFTRLQIPVQSDTSKVVWLTDDETCQKILVEYNAYLVSVGGSRPPATQLYVMRVGTSFVVSDTYSSGAQEWKSHLVLDKQYTVLGAFGH